jgi:hypothetical protein
MRAAISIAAKWLLPFATPHKKAEVKPGDAANLSLVGKE